MMHRHSYNINDSVFHTKLPLVLCAVLTSLALYPMVVSLAGGHIELARGEVVVKYCLNTVTRWKYVG